MAHTCPKLAVWGMASMQCLLNGCWVHLWQCLVSNEWLKYLRSGLLQIWRTTWPREQPSHLKLGTQLKQRSKVHKGQAGA